MPNREGGACSAFETGGWLYPVLRGFRRADSRAVGLSRMVGAARSPIAARRTNKHRAFAAGTGCRQFPKATRRPFGCALSTARRVENRDPHPTISGWWETVELLVC